MGKGSKAKGRTSGNTSGKGVGNNSKAESSPEEKKLARKAGRRAEQLAKLDDKLEAEATYFWECKARNQRVDKAGARQSHEEIFATQGTFAIDFAKYDAVEVTRSGPGANDAKVLDSFQDLGRSLPRFLSENLKLMRYSVPTPIQKHAIPLALQARDLMSCAQTGSGKTAAFLIPVVASLSSPHCRPACRSDGPDDPALPRCVIMAPTRELIQQIHVEARKCCYNSGGLRAVVIYGGANARQQLLELAGGCDIAVATPGRLTDFVDRSLVELRMVEHLVLDEADRMLDMGFEPQIRLLVQQRDMPDEKKRRTMMFSATFPAEIQKLAKEFLKPYVFIAIGRVGGTTENIEQRLLLASAEKRQKFDLLLEELKRVAGKTLVFVQKKRVATQLKKWLKAEGVSAEDIHGDRSQSQREAALAAFRSGACQILCATDVAARGLDIPKVEHVINFDLPTSPDEFDAYVHRIGRTGRAGNTGISTSFYVPGRDPKVGNAGIAPALCKIFKETSNHIPDWFWQLPEAAALGGGKGAEAGNSRMSGDIRGGREVVQTSIATKSGKSADASSSTSSMLKPTAFQNSITALLEAAQKHKFKVHYYEAPDYNGGFWCEATIYNSADAVICKGDASSSKKKDAKHDAAKVCMAVLEMVLHATNGKKGSQTTQSKARSNDPAVIASRKDQDTSASWTWGTGWKDQNTWPSSDASSGQQGSNSVVGSSRRQGRNGPRTSG